MAFLKLKEREQNTKLIIISVLISVSIILQVYFQIILNIEIVFSHFFYIPILLACLWWKKKGLIIPFSLAGLLIFLPILTGLDIISVNHVDNLFRALLLIIIGLVVAFLSEQISKKEQQLTGRVKELNCLYGIIKTINDPNRSIEEILHSTLDRIKCAWQFPKLVSAKIDFDGKEYKTENFQKTPWQIYKAVMVRDKELSVNIHYLEEKEFLKEEETLLNEILHQLKAIFDLKLTWIK